MTVLPVIITNTTITNNVTFILDLSNYRVNSVRKYKNSKKNDNNNNTNGLNEIYC